MTTDTPSPSTDEQPNTARWRSLSRQQWAIAAVALLAIVGLTVSTAALARSHDNANALIAEQTDEMADLEDEIDLRDDRIAEYQDNEAAVASQASSLSAQIAELEDREAEVAAAEAAVAQAQTAVVASQIRDGLYVIGTTAEPGTYQTQATSGSCYYSFLTGTGADADIIDNNIVAGPTVVTLSAGDVFESSRCGTWQRIG